jgi:TorA maturation chaperone TorD
MTMTTHVERETGRASALARAVVYRYLSEALHHPSRATRSEGEWREALEVALSESEEPVLFARAEVCIVQGADRERVESDYRRVLGHTPRAGVPPYESEWLGAAGDLLQYHQMADVSAYYRAHGLALDEGCDERVDHASVELSFLHFLCVKEAWAQSRADEELASVARAGQRGFLEQHVSRWMPAFFHRLGAEEPAGFFAALGRFAGPWIAQECARLGVTPGDPTLAPGETSMTLDETCVSCAAASSCVPGGAAGGESA